MRTSICKTSQSKYAMDLQELKACSLISAKEQLVSSEKFWKLTLCHKIALPCCMLGLKFDQGKHISLGHLFATSPPQTKNKIESDKPTGTSAFPVPASLQCIFTSQHRN